MDARLFSFLQPRQQSETVKMQRDNVLYGVTIYVSCIQQIFILYLYSKSIHVLVLSFAKNILLSFKCFGFVN